MSSQNNSRTGAFKTFFIPQCEVSIIHKKLQPDEISEVLDLNPTSTVRIGESVGGVTARQSIWVLDSYESVQSHDLEAHLNWLVSKFSSKRSVIKTLRKSGAIMELGILIDTWNSFERIIIPPSIVTTVGHLGIGITLDLVIHEDRREFFSYMDCPD
ncbi:MAG: DUF4279 domain-containing protein [Candidatus Obscuribacter sp.]|nr:DUF4279 domain-containing protein [Candidatus Obscuribacter sp.]